MEIRVALCDDEEPVREYLGRLLEEWKEKQNDQLQIECFESAESFLFQYEEDKRWQLLILDIEMGKMNGVELAKKVREHNKEVQILFVTGYMDYISDGYEVEALHYLLKPVTKEKLFSVLDRARERMQTSEKALFLQGSDEAVRIPYYEIRYVEVQHNYVTINAAEDYTVKKTLSELEEELGDGFFRTGRSFLVNLKCVKRITKKEVSLKDGMVIPLSRGMYEKINRAMIRYF